MRFTLALAAGFAILSFPALASFDNPYDRPDNSICGGIDSCMNATIAGINPRVPPCPAMGGDASKHSWALWKANFPAATQCIISGSTPVIVDVPEK